MFRNKVRDSDWRSTLDSRLGGFRRLDLRLFPNKTEPIQEPGFQLRGKGRRAYVIQVLPIPGVHNPSGQLQNQRTTTETNTLRASLDLESVSSVATYTRGAWRESPTPRPCRIPNLLQTQHVEKDLVGSGKYIIIGTELAKT